jgi:ribosome-binding factor A
VLVRDALRANIVSMASEPRRPERVAEMVLRELSLMLIRDLKDPRLRGITLTGVRMTDDLRHGRVFFSHLEGKSRAAEAVTGFKSAGGFIRRQVCRVLGLRYAPELEFEFDPGPERAARIDVLLRSARKD